jgi:3-hydroxyisobutyrate dehydrogenase-like beta-hydroxyacid dehydrogenase
MLSERVRAHGATMLDAPVSGSVPQVQSGTLTIMVGGDEAAYARVDPLLRGLGTAAAHRDIAAIFEVLSRLETETEAELEW